MAIGCKRAQQRKCWPGLGLSSMSRVEIEPTTLDQVSPPILRFCLPYAYSTFLPITATRRASQRKQLRGPSLHVVGTAGFEPATP